MLSIISNLVCPGMALGMGFLAYKHMNKFWKLLFFQMLAYGLTLVVSYLLTAYQNSRGLDENTLVVYNVFMVIEMFILIMAAHTYFDTLISKYMAIAAYVLFLMVFIKQISNNPDSFANYASAAESSLLMLFYGAVFYKQMVFRSGSLTYSPEIWMCLGLLIFLAGCIPYIILINYMQKHFPKENIILYGNIIYILAIIRYVFLALGFFLVRKNALSLRRAHE